MTVATIEEMRKMEDTGNETIDTLVEDGAGEDQEPEGPPPVEGTIEQLSLDAGGDPPTTTSMTLQGGKVSVEGEFKKGEVVTFYVEARVSDVTFSDKWDSKIMAVVGTERKHKAKVQGIRRVS